MAGFSTKRTRRRIAIVIGSALVFPATALIACGPPPIGWQGAGRQQELPAPQGVEAGSPAAAPDSGPDDMDGGTDTGMETDSGDEDVSQDASGANPTDTGTGSDGDAHPGNPGHSDASADGSGKT